MEAWIDNARKKREIDGERQGYRLKEGLFPHRNAHRITQDKTFPFSLCLDRVYNRRPA